MKILLIDDDPLIRNSLQNFLEERGHQVIACSDAEQGLKLYQQKPSLVVLSDLDIPGTNGIQLFTQLKQINPDVPFIIISGISDINLAIEAIKLGAWDYIVKPITDFSKLHNALERAYERSKLISKNKKYKQLLEKTNKKLNQSLSELKEDQQAGGRVQFSLLPENNLIIDNFNFSYLVKPYLYLSGDFIDYFEIDSNYIGFYLADVSGHGAASAFVTMLLKFFFGQAILDYQQAKNAAILQPSEIIAKLNTHIHQAKLSKYATMVYGVINKSTKLLKYSVNGHFPYPIFYNQSQKTPKFLSHQSFAVGIFEDATYQTYSLNLDEKFYLVIFSDGLLAKFATEKSKADKEKKILELFNDKIPDIIFLENWLLNNNLVDDVACLLIKSTN